MRWEDIYEDEMWVGKDLERGSRSLLEDMSDIHLKRPSKTKSGNTAEIRTWYIPNTLPLHETNRRLTLIVIAAQH
jgi:hypothetical protein